MPAQNSCPIGLHPHNFEEFREASVDNLAPGPGKAMDEPSGRLPLMQLATRLAHQSLSCHRRHHWRARLASASYELGMGRSLSRRWLRGLR